MESRRLSGIGDIGRDGAWMLAAFENAQFPNGSTLTANPRTTQQHRIIPVPVYVERDVLGRDLHLVPRRSQSLQKRQVKSQIIGLRYCLPRLPEHQLDKGIIVTNPGAMVAPYKYRVRDRIQEFLTAGDTRH